MNSATLRMVLNTLSAIFIVTGGWLWIRVPEIPNVDLPAQEVKLNRGTILATGPASSSNATAIVSANIFTASRAAPDKRYTPPGGGTAVDPTSEPMQAELATPLIPPPRVYGTMTGPDGATALIQPDTTGASSRLYREGDRVGVFRIEKILTASVIVRGPSGRQELKVEQREDPRE